MTSTSNLQKVARLSTLSTSRMGHLREDRRLTWLVSRSSPLIPQMFQMLIKTKTEVQMELQMEALKVETATQMTQQALAQLWASQQLLLPCLSWPADWFDLKLIFAANIGHLVNCWAYLRLHIPSKIKKQMQVFNWFRNKSFYCLSSIFTMISHLERSLSKQDLIPMHIFLA